MHSWPREAVPHPLAALGVAQDTFRVNPIFCEDSENEDLPALPCCPAAAAGDSASVSSAAHSDTNKQTTPEKGRPTSISSGYGSTATEEGLVLVQTPLKSSPASSLIPRPVWPSTTMDLTRKTLLELAEVANLAAAARACTASRNKSNQHYEMEQIRVRLRAALDQLSRSADRDKDGCRCITYSGLEVRPGDVHMKAKQTDLNIYSSSMGHFTLDAARGEVLKQRLAAARRRRRTWRAVAAFGAVVLLVVSVAAAELALSSGRRVFGLFL